MPPKVKITKEDIVQAALSLQREYGAGAVNARSLAAALHCSTQPVFSNFETMDALQKAVTRVAYERYFAFLKRETESEKYPKYKAYGMAYIRFAREERELFRLLFMCDRRGEDLTPAADFEESVQMIAKANGVTVERARLMHLEMWACVHGIATMAVTSFLDLEWELISRMLSDVYQGIRERHLKEEKDERDRDQGADEAL